jgi:3-hydroxyisobutyrate dehydrogenase
MTQPQSELRIGFIGIGLMGEPMAKRLMDSGFSVSVWNRNPDKTTSLKNNGATVAESVESLTQESDIIMLCVTDTEAVEQVVFADGGIFESLRPDQVIVDFSSIDPQASKLFARKVQSETGAQWLDSPVSGGVSGAENGTLVVMVGGDCATLDRIAPVLKPLSQRITHMGPAGSGQATKVCNQILVSCNVMVMAEVLALAEKAGVDATKLPSALQGGFADSIPLQITGQRMADNQLDEVKWHVKTLLKDLNLAQVLATDFSSDTPMANLAQSLMLSHSTDGYADKDPATLIERYRSKSL